MRPLLLCAALLCVGCSSDQAATASGPDEVFPTVAITGPAAGAVLSGYATITATASDNRGIAGVQFKIDGVNLGSEDTEAPYSYSWNTMQGDNATHVIAAVARDIDGNGTTSSPVTVTVDNPTVADIRLEVTTTGSDLDGDGYTVTVGATAVHLSPNQSVVVPGLPRGTLPVLISGVAGNCTVLGYVQTSVPVSLEGISLVAFKLRCASLSSPVERIVWRHGSATSGSTPALFSMNGNGSDKRLFLDDDATDPEWSSDRTRVYFRSERAGVTGPGIYSYEEASGIQAFEATATATDASTSPDRRGIAFSAFGNQVASLLAGSGITVVSFGLQPAWAPGTDSILFARDGDIWIGTSLGANVHRVIADGSSPRWSPNGSKFLFWRDQGSGVGSYWIANADGTGGALVTQGSFIPDDGASWSPSGRQFVYSSTAGGQSNLWVINIDGTGATNVTNGTGETNVQPTWFR